MWLRMIARSSARLAMPSEKKTHQIEKWFLTNACHRMFIYSARFIIVDSGSLWFTPAKRLQIYVRV